MDLADDLVDALLAAPAGVALLARLEAAARTDCQWWESPHDSDAAAVARAAVAVADGSLGWLLGHALEAAGMLAGPWMPEAPRDLARAYQLAEARRPLAEAVAARFGPQLHDHGRDAAPELWLDHRPDARPPLIRFRDLRDGYSSGEFPWGGLWTVTAPPPAVHDELVCWWEMWGSPITRWRLPVAPTARVLQIHRPQDWVDLVARHPGHPVGMHDGWELPGRNQHRTDLAPLLAIGGQRACRVAVAEHLVPDWTSVAQEHDGVHLSWVGFLTAEGFVADLPGGGVAMLRYWASERTLWLADVFGDPEPMPAPALSGQVDDLRGADVTADAALRSADRRHIDLLLGR